VKIAKWEMGIQLSVISYQHSAVSELKADG
jgi:hypothetical protein